MIFKGRPTPSISNIWYIVEEQSYYDRGWITVKEFITKTPGKFKNPDPTKVKEDKWFTRYISRKVEVK